MQPIELLRGLRRLVPGAEQHGVDHAKGGMETSDRVVQQVGMLGQRDGNPGVGQLQQRRTPRPEKNCRLAVHMPGDGTRAEEPMARFTGQPLERIKQILAGRARDVLPGCWLRRHTSLNVRQSAEREHKFNG